MNIQLKDITVTARDGRVSHLDQVYIRGSHVRFFIVPDMLKYVTLLLLLLWFFFPSPHILKIHLASLPFPLLSTMHCLAQAQEFHLKPDKDSYYSLTYPSKLTLFLFPPES